MKISSIETRLYYVPLPAGLTDSMHGEMRHFSMATVQIKTDSGAEGLGHTYTVGKTGGSAVLAMLRDDLVPMLVGTDPRCTQRLWEQMSWRLHYVGRGGIASFAISAVDIALWDLKAKLADEPLWRFLAGHTNRAKVYALCHYGASDWNFLLRFECDLHRDSQKQLAWKYFRHYSTVRDVMVDPERFGVPAEALRGKP